MRRVRMYTSTSGKTLETTIPHTARKKAEYKKIGSSWYYVVNLDANTIGIYDIYFTATKDGYSVMSSHKKLTVTKAATPGQRDHRTRGKRPDLQRQ